MGASVVVVLDVEDVDDVDVKASSPSVNTEPSVVVVVAELPVVD